MQVRRAKLSDIDSLIYFTSEEAREAEGSTKIPTTLREGIGRGLEDESIALYWVLVDENDQLQGSISALKEWSDWNAGFYWWIQSMYLVKFYRGQGLMQLLLAAVKQEMAAQKGLELRLYVHRENKAAVKAYTKAGFIESPYEIMVYDTTSETEENN